MLIALLYHKIGKGKYANPLDLLEAHFAHIAAHYSTVLPGDPLPKGAAVCLTFDDAYCDFYSHIFPLLKTYNLKALLAVPTASIAESTPLSIEERLKESDSFCTWEELRTLSRSPLIQIASHSHTHRPLTAPEADAENELVVSKKILEEKLSLPISSFVYPFGKWNKAVHTLAQKHYRYIFRIGNAYNFSWGNRHNLLYRINGDALPFPHYPFTPLKRVKHTTRLLLNSTLQK